MRLLGNAFLLLLLVSLNCVLGTRLVVGGAPLPPLGRFLSPQEGFWQNAEAVNAHGVRSMRLAGLEQPVQIAWDELGIPHLFAANDHDLYRAQGWVVAGLRLWQMDFISRAAAGRISEVIGAAGLNFDRTQRRKGMGIGAEATTEALMNDSVMAPLLEAYADGVNQYINSLRYRDLPVEYKLLDHRPEPWSVLQSVFIQQYMVENLSGWDRDLENSNALQALGAELFELIYPERPPGVAPTVASDGPWPFNADTLIAPPAAYNSNAYTIDNQRSNPANGSNNWAVSGARSASGKPMLANDTHLGLNFPSIWIPIQLATPDHRVFGFTLPGACGLVIGHNEHAAWGVTNAPRDTRDHYRITWQDERRQAYKYDGRWLPVDHRVEQIKVRGERMLVDSIRITLHGPVQYDEHFGTMPHKTDLALRWMGHEPTLTQKALYLMNRVKNHTDYVEALRYFDAPAQNWVFASTDGTIAMRVQGRFPNKWRGQGRFVLDGADPMHRWQGWIPFAHTATEVDPPRGYVSSANQHSVDEGYPYWFYHGHMEYYRNRRINALLEQATGLGPSDMMSMQHDRYDLKAAEGLAAMLPLLDTTGLSHEGHQVLEILRAWDHQIDQEAESRALFDHWFEGLRSALWGALQEGPIPMGEVTAYTTIRILGDSSLWSTVSAALELDIAALVRTSFLATVEHRTTNGPNSWGELNNARVIHLARIPAFSREGLPVNGSSTALNAQRGNHGPSQRFIVELSEPPRAWFQLPGGSAGNPGSVHYDDMLDEWYSDRYREVHFLESARAGADLGFPISTLTP